MSKLTIEEAMQQIATLTQIVQELQQIPLRADDETEWLKTHKDLRGFGLAQSKKGKKSEIVLPSEPGVWTPPAKPLATYPLKEERILTEDERRGPQTPEALALNHQLKTAKLRRAQEATGESEWIPIGTTGVAMRNGGRRDDSRTDPRSGASGNAEFAKQHNRGGGVIHDAEALEEINAILNSPEEK